MTLSLIEEILDVIESNPIPAMVALYGNFEMYNKLKDWQHKARAYVAQNQTLISGAGNREANNGHTKADNSNPTDEHEAGSRVPSVQ